MSRRNKIILLFFILLIFAALSRPLRDLIPYRYDSGTTAAEHLSPERIKVISPDRIIKLIKPKPSAAVLDIGAGYGLFTFPLARIVGTSGKVFATDVEPRVIEYLAEEAHREGLGNVFPVRVTSFGLDPFYTRHLFDVILAADVLPDIVMPERFIGKLRPSLRKDTGRFWVTVTRPDPDFSELEFKESPNIFQVLFTTRVQSTIGPRLRAITRRAFEAKPPSAIDRAAALLTEDLNALLEDPSLWAEAQNNKWPLSRRNAYLMEGLSGVLEKQGVFKKGVGVSDEKSRLALRVLNRFIIIDLLGLELWGKAIVFSDLNERDARHQVHQFERQVGSEAIISMFRRAGYALVKEHRITPYSYIFEFKNP